MSPALQADSLPPEPPGKPGWPVELMKINVRLARAAVTDTTNWWLKWNKLIIPLFWRLEVCDNATDRPVLPSKALRRLSSSSFSWWFPGLWKHNCSPHRASPCVCVCMSASRFPFYNDIVILEKGPSNDLILTCRETEGKRRRGQQRMRWLDKITAFQWRWIGAKYGRWWRTGKLACCSPWGRKESDMATEHP